MNGKGVFKRFVALLIALILAAAPVFVYAESDGSSENNQSAGDSLTATKGTYWFDPHVTGTDLTDNYVYDDALLTGDSLEFSWPLATMTFELAVASISSEREPNTEEGYKNKSRNLKAYLEDNGFVDFDTNDDYKKSMTMTTMGAACAHKKIVDNGTEYTVLAIVPRSAGYEAEWGSNFIIGETGDHEGFRLGKEKVLEFAKEYVSKYKINGKIKVWAPGYSRGAGVMELVGAEILRDPQEAIGINVEPENFYCYTYGSPNSAGTDTDYNDDKFKRIHNVYESYDLMTVLPFAKLGFSRCGEEVHYADDSRKQQMLDLLAELNSDVYTKFTTVGDPDNFTLKTIDVDALTNDHQLKFVDDENSYLPDNQREFLDLFNGIALAAFTDRAGYVASSQDAVSKLASYYFSHTNKADAIGAGIMGSKHTIPAMISLYLAYMMERNSETSITSDDKTKLLSWISELKENAGMDDGDSQSGTEDVPEDLTEAVTEFVTAFASAEKFGDLLDASAKLSSLLTSYVLADALTSAGLDQEDQDLYNKLTSQEYCGALSHVAAYYLLYDELQTEGLSESYLNQQFQHLATMVSNISSFRPPHYNEVLLSWFRTIDPTYADFSKETDAQKTGYRRVYVGDMTGVSGEISDGRGNAVASFTDGKITKRTDKWIGITTCDNGGWLRLPLENSYKVSLSRADGKAISLKLTEYRVDDNKEVRTVTSDSKYDWSDLKVEKGQSVVLNLSAVEAKDGSYELGDNGSEADYSVTISDVSKDDDQKKDDSKDPSGKKDESKNSSEKKDDSKDSTQKKDNTRVKSPLTVKGKTVKIKASKVKKSTVRIARKKAITVKKAKGTVTYEKIKVLKGKKKASKKIASKFTVKKKTGKFTVKKGIKKGKYKLKIKVKDAGKGKYLPASKTVTVTVVIK